MPCVFAFLEVRRRAPGVTSMASAAVSSRRSRTVRRPRSSASSTVSVSSVAARVRSVAAAAAGLEARARSKARGRPPLDALPVARFAGFADSLARVFQHSRKETPVIVVQLVAFFGLFAIRKRSFGLEKVADVCAAPLYQMRGQARGAEFSFAFPVRSSGRLTKSGSSRPRSDRKDCSLPEWGVAVTRMMWRPLSGRGQAQKRVDGAGAARRGLHRCRRRCGPRPR